MFFKVIPKLSRQIIRNSNLSTFGVTLIQIHDSKYMTFGANKKPLSISATLSIVILVMGALAIALSLMAGGIYRDLTFENQRDALSNLIHIKTNDILNELGTISAKLGSELTAEDRFKQAYAAKDTAAIQKEINEQFFQYYVTANVINLAKLYVLDIDFQPIAESTQGESNIPLNSSVCPEFLNRSKQRKGAQRLKPTSEVCTFNEKPYFSAVTAIGGLRPKGYIQIVINPVHNLKAIETELGMPINIHLPNDDSVYKSTDWPDTNSQEQVLVAVAPVITPQYELALNIQVANPVKDLLNELAHTRLIIILIALLVTMITVLSVMWLLRRTTVNPLRRLTRQLRLVRKDKTHLGEQVSVEGNMEVRELAADFNEMTGELKELYTALKDMAFTDSLTDLPNRALFQDRIEQLTELSKREGRKFCVMMMDLDRFKEVNDTLGHEYGDKLLQIVSERLTASLRKSDSISLVKDDTVARLGGDEFAALLPTTQTADGGTVVARKITDLMTTPFKIDDHTFSVGISIGISMFPDDGEDATTLIRHADIAMYHAKKSQKGFAFYNKDLDKHSLDNLTLGNQLRESIQNDKLDIHFQPKIDFNSGRICGAEALVRWQHPERGFIPPDQFVALAEKIGLIQPLTLWVLNRSLEECSRWNKQNLPLSIAVNLSALSLHDATTTGIINDALKDWKLPPSLLSLELTESAMMNDPQLAMEILAELGSKGINISVDDFGTGYSSLTYLKRLPVNEIKIDRSFVMDMFSNQQDEAIVKSTIDLAHNMKLKVIAEGIEDNITYQKLKNMGCDMGQGFYMGRPVNKRDLAEWLKISPWGLKNKSK